jgi:hypothetical protein
MKTSILLTLALLLGLHVHAQHRTCLTPDPDPSILRKWQQERTASKALRGGTSYPYRSISLFMHIIVEDKTPTSTPAQLQQMVDIANQYFAPVNMHFTICGFDYVFLADNMTGWGPGFINMMADNYDRHSFCRRSRYLPFTRESRSDLFSQLSIQPKLPDTTNRGSVCA